MHQQHVAIAEVKRATIQCTNFRSQFSDMQKALDWPHKIGVGHVKRHRRCTFTNHQFANNGLAPRDGDLGRMEVTGNAADEGKFKVPSLRNVAVTGPYMHDGRFTTLEEVIDHYDHGVLRSPTLDPNLAKHPDTGLGLSAADKTALLAFLRTLTDDAFIGRQPLPASPPTPALTQQ